MAYKLTLEAVKAAAREAYYAGALGFQKGELLCQYVGSGSHSPCAVGAALPFYVAEGLVRDGLNELNVTSLVRDGHLEVDDDDDLLAIRRIQWAHDTVLQGQRNPDCTPTWLAESEALLRELIGIPKED